MSTIDEWWNDDEDYNSISSASDVTVKRINPETGEIETIRTERARKGDMIPGKTLKGLTSERHGELAPGVSGMGHNGEPTKATKVG